MLEDAIIHGCTESKATGSSAGTSSFLRLLTLALLVSLRASRRLSRRQIVVLMGELMPGGLQESFALV